MAMVLHLGGKFLSFLAWLRAKRLLSDWMLGTVNIDSNWLPGGWDLELIENKREFIFPKKTPKEISRKVPYRFVTLPSTFAPNCILFDSDWLPEITIFFSVLNLWNRV
ncbi:hypothetical protein TNCV_4694221 [Trichonephila clavipes]|uniref:Uncharacterized protein n=1 Tax=Trichonephila clavipes TaxID=2585209 RepID=A0A8X7BHP9_TRICX|nr:hypothetical protein TNCV_4694221 [Trichonephila clavipes]